MDSSGGSIVVSLIMLLVLLTLYFLPALIAQHRGRDGLLMIALLNLVLGWTVIGWIVLLVVSFTGESSEQQRARREELNLLRKIAQQGDQR